MVNQQHEPNAVTIGLGVIGFAVLSWNFWLPGNIAADEFTLNVQPVLKNYCSDCHLGPDAEAGFDFSAISTPEQINESIETWDAVVEHLKSQTMPPEDEPQPTLTEREVINNWYQKVVSSIQPRPAEFRPRRLSVVEYRKTLRSVLGFDLEVSIVEAEQTVSETSLVIKLLPIDPPGESGFKNDTHGNPISVVSWNQYSFLIDTALEELFSDRRQAELASLMGASELKDKTAAFEFERTDLESLFRTLLTRAYRRTADEGQILDVLTRLSDVPEQDTVDAVKLEIKTVLMSARFLYRGLGMTGQSGRQPVDQFELAERLSYFLWADMPDQRLLVLAEQNQLNKDNTLHDEIDRMLSSDKSRALAEVFATEWLTLDEINRVSKNPPIVAALKSQPLDFMNYLFTEDRPLTELIDSDVSFINPHTSSMYGTDSKQMVKYAKQRGIEIEAVENQQIQLKATSERGGILTMPGVLAMNKGPILRGTWILERIMGEHLPDPPMNISPVPPNQRGENLTFRERFQQHRNSPTCAVCHDKIDPIGFSLDSYDDGGRYYFSKSMSRKKKKKPKGLPVAPETIDTSGRLPTGETFKNIDELKQILASSQRRNVIRNIVERTMSYALCRRLKYYDRPTVERIAKKMDQSNGTWRELIYEIADSIPFRETVVTAKQSSQEIGDQR